MNSPQPLYKYLRRKKDRVADLVTKANFLSQLNQEFLKFIPAPVNQHVEFAHIDGTCIHVIADSPAWAAKFRFMTSHLVPTLNKNIQYFNKVKQIIVITRPSREKHFTQNRQLQPQSPRILSAEANNCLTTMAKSLDESHLKQSLLRLANRYRQNKK